MWDLKNMKKLSGLLQWATSGTRVIREIRSEYRSNLDVTGQTSLRTGCSQTLLLLPAVVHTVRNNGTIAPIPGHAYIYCMCMRCPHLHLFFSPLIIRALSPEPPLIAHFQNAAVCSMYIDEFLTLYIRTVQVWYSYSHSGFYFLFSLIKVIAIFL